MSIPVMRARDHVNQDEGSATVELVLATVLLVIMAFTTIQIGMWAHAAHVVRSAAGDALIAVQVTEGTEADSTAAALDAVGDLDGGVSDLEVTAERGLTEANVTVTGVAPSIFPGLDFPVSATASGPVEVFTEADP